jgi:hypothetical protein
MQQCPKAASDFIVRDMDGEKLVYNLRNHNVSSLSAVAARVWSMCDGQTNLESMAASLQDLGPKFADRKVVELVLHRLSEAGLLEASAEMHPRDKVNVGRRGLVNGIALGAAALAVTSIVSPTPAHASSSGACITSEDCTDPSMPICANGECSSGGI